MVRLKGGDPFIFGRGGEELDALREAGIEIEIVPGVTAGIAAAASLQIPLTHRDVSHTVTFLSGHEAGGEEPSFEHLDLAALASGKNTLLVYMGVTTAGVDRQEDCSRRASRRRFPCSRSRMRAATTSAACSRPSPSLPRVPSASGSRAPPC